MNFLHGVNLSETMIGVLVNLQRNLIPAGEVPGGTYSALKRRGLIDLQWGWLPDDAAVTLTPAGRIVAQLLENVNTQEVQA